MPAEEIKEEIGSGILSVGIFRWLARRKLVLVLVICATVAGLAFLLSPGASHFNELPNPNGYDALVRAAASVVRLSKGPREMTLQELEAAVVGNRRVIEEVRSLLASKSAVPVVFDQNWFTVHSTELMNLKAAAQAMDAEACLMQKQDGFTNALNICLDQMRLGLAVERGGVMIDSLVGGTCEIMAVFRLTNLVSKLDADQCRKAVNALEEIDSQRESYEQDMTRENEWQRRTHSVFIRAKESFKKHILRQKDSFRNLLPDDSRASYDYRVYQFRRLLLKTASRGFELDHGRKPKQASDLVPAHLRAIPHDPKKNSEFGLE